MIVVIGHRSRHGKDTFARMLVDAVGDRRAVFIRSFASAVKEQAQSLFGRYGLQNEAFYNTGYGAKLRNIKLPKINLTPVECWIEVGEGMRRIYWDIWRDKILDFYATQVEPVDGILICPDVRHFNEIEIANLKIKVTNPRVPNRQGASIDDVLEDYVGWNLHVLNDRDLSDLRIVANNITETYLVPAATPDGSDQEIPCR